MAGARLLAIGMVVLATTIVHARPNPRWRTPHTWPAGADTTADAAVSELAYQWTTNDLLRVVVAKDTGAVFVVRCLGPRERPDCEVVAVGTAGEVVARAIMRDVFEDVTTQTNRETLSTKALDRTMARLTAWRDQVKALTGTGTLVEQAIKRLPFTRADGTKIAFARSTLTVTPPGARSPSTSIVLAPPKHGRVGATFASVLPSGATLVGVELQDRSHTVPLDGSVGSSWHFEVLAAPSP